MNNTVLAPMCMIRGYKGSFHPNIEKIIKNIIKDKFTVHLFSGSSKIGNIRVDIENKNATHKQNVYDFIQDFELKEKNAILLLDPDYHIKRAELKLKIHGIKESLSGNVLAHKLLYQFLDKNHFDEILLLDYCSPEFKNFKEINFWRVKYQGWVNNRTLTHYKRCNVSLTLSRNENQ